jgi:hypothetical protein
MRTVLVTIETPHGRADLELSGDIPIGDIVPALRQVFCVPPALRGDYEDSWQLGPAAGRPLPGSRSLIECGVLDGTRLLFQSAHAWKASDGAASAPASTAQLPADDTGGIGIHWRREGLTP